MGGSILLPFLVSFHEIKLVCGVFFYVDDISFKPPLRGYSN